MKDIGFLWEEYEKVEMRSKGKSMEKQVRNLGDLLNEIREVVILAAGRSRRMENLSRKLPKCLLPYRGERIVQRLVRQIKACGVEKIVITIGYRADTMRKIFADDPQVVLVENKMYEEDVNINSMSLALSQISGPCAVFEADTIMEDSLVQYVLGSDFEGKSVWFTRGKFNETQYGGILRSDKYGNVNDVKIVPSWQQKYKSYTKLSGLMRVGPAEIELFTALVNKYARTTLKQYFLNAWIENIRLLPSMEADISAFKFFTFNKPDEYYQVQNAEVDEWIDAPNVENLHVKDLRHIEAFDEQRARTLQQKIVQEGVWTRPLIVEKKRHLVLDGQHRLECAQALGLAVVPCLPVDYDEVAVWSLRKEYRVSATAVRRKVQRGEIYPYKTVKHKFKFLVPELHIPLSELQW